ncbi:MAG: 4-hydroxyphenylacetate 3-monooxygenase [Gaiellales bacterium]|jgi:4-hydroxyphenylacetate 3-monooxygenase/chlorophenol-4-monooxygenase component 2|nr:4-hydroxyphenylacetate 3-monooxygenase [Gaiellales bacterium]MDX6592557.1 4-hydroxyphenylacetate 3-monooxygenase [Gaiellales bacterium]
MSIATDAKRLGIDKVVEALDGSADPHLLTGDQYRQTLRDGRRVVSASGEEIEDVTTHPATTAVNSIARVLDLQFDPATRDTLTYVDEAGARRAVGWQVPTTKEHLSAKRDSTRRITLETLGMYGRPPDYGPMMSLGFLAVIDRVEAENPEFAENMRKYVTMSGDLNLLSTDLIADPQSDRRIPKNEKPGQLRIVEDRPDGIVVRGAKVAGSIGALCHMLTLSTVLGEGVTDDAAIWAGVPVNSAGLSLVLREPTVPPNPNPGDHPVEARGEETDQIYLFDDVFIPKEFVFSVRNRALLDVYYESGAYMLWSIMMRLGFRAEIFAGVAQAITEILGTDVIPGVQNAVAEITLYAQTLRAYTVATIEEAVEWCGVQVPNPPLVTAGRLYSIKEYPRITYLMKDLCGQALISRWPEKVWDHPEFGPMLEEYLPGTGVTAREKNQFFSFVWDLLSGAHANRVALFENVNATPPAYVAHLVYQHTDRSEMARFAREYAGISPVSHT